MKTAIGDADWLLLNMAQDDYSRAQRDMKLCIGTVATKLGISRDEAEKRLKDGMLTEKLNEQGIEIYVQRNCQKAWPDVQTWAVWALMAIGYATVFCLAANIGPAA